MQSLSDDLLRNRAAQQPAAVPLASTVKRLPCSALVSLWEVMRKICSPARNSVKVKEFAAKQRNQTSRGRADVDGWRLRGVRCSGEQQNTVLLFNFLHWGLTISVVSSRIYAQPFCMMYYQQNIICINYCHNKAKAAAINSGFAQDTDTVQQRNSNTTLDWMQMIR